MISFTLTRSAELLCGCQAAEHRVLLFSYDSSTSRPKRDLLPCMARPEAVTLPWDAPLSKAQRPGLSVSQTEPSGVFLSRFSQPSSRSLGHSLLLGQRSRMNLFSDHIGSLLHQDRRMASFEPLYSQQSTLCEAWHPSYKSHDEACPLPFGDRRSAIRQKIFS